MESLFCESYVAIRRATVSYTHLYFDTIFCYGPNHIREIREMERIYELPAKTLVRTGFPLLDAMIEGAKAIGETVNDPKVILIAPSWQQDNILEYLSLIHI